MPQLTVVLSDEQDALLRKVVAARYAKEGGTRMSLSGYLRDAGIAAAEQEVKNL